LLLKLLESVENIGRISSEIKLKKKGWWGGERDRRGKVNERGGGGVYI
jgi:hypothetical protein